MALGMSSGSQSGTQGTVTGTVEAHGDVEAHGKLEVVSPAGDSADGLKAALLDAGQELMYMRGKQEAELVQAREKARVDAEKNILAQRHAHEKAAAKEAKEFEADRLEQEAILKQKMASTSRILVL